jgi:hypothetical protein
VPWALFGRVIASAIGEAGLYAVCAIVFIGFGGLVLHPLIMGSGSPGRFYKLFAVAFGAYSIAWIAGWMLLRGHAGSVVGLLAGTAVMGWILTRAFGARDALVPVILVLFVTNAAGYFFGGWLEGALMPAMDSPVSGAVPRRVQIRIAMLVWGVCYGLGFGAGLGYAFHRCQRAARALIESLDRSV